MTDLIAALDAAAAKLLDQAGLGPTTPEKIEATPAERVKAFDSVMEYAKLRPDLVPKKQEESAFDRIKRDFNGDGEKVERRGRPRKDKTAPGPEPGTDVDGVQPAVTVNGASADLFDA